MHYHGRVHKVGEHIDTDAIIPARFLVTSDPVKLGANCMAGIAPDWVQRVRPGDILVAGRNFGCGSSREHAPIAILGAGMPVVIGHSFARIFYRNAFNMGLLLMEVGDEVDKLRDGDELEIDADKGKIHDLSTGVDIACPPLPVSMSTILASGGLVGYVKKRLSKHVTVHSG
ncbi:MAG: 3-isopropylmalate dehydratase small subunit [Desulfovibrio sp.]|nr:3-isopropylmalate dehydratase small subunit [Desulfovibrio sp.]